MNNQKTFNDLVFNPHANVPNGIQAKLNLGNDIEISVVSMRERDGEYGGLYGDASEGTYEVAVFRFNDMLPLRAFDDVLGWHVLGLKHAFLDGKLRVDSQVDFYPCRPVLADE